jgi:hypothetical protein
VDLSAEINWGFAVVARSPGGRVQLATCLLFVDEKRDERDAKRDEERSFAGITARAGALARAAGHTWSHDLYLAFDDVALDVPHEGWHRFAHVDGSLDVAGQYLRAERPSAQATHIRFAILRAPESR